MRDDDASSTPARFRSPANAPAASATTTGRHGPASHTAASARLLPLGAIAAGFGLAASAALAQNAAPAPAASASASAAAPATPSAAPTAARSAADAPVPLMPVVRARATREPGDRETVQATTTRIGKGEQELRDIPQSVTVVTERLIDDRNLDTLKDALRQTAGVTFLAAEGGEEDIRLRGFALQQTGDVFQDTMRDPAFYDRDTFFLDRVELIRGSASMLFGRGSTGGAVNLVTKTPRLLNEHQIDVTLGRHAYRRAVGDFNFRLGDSSAARIGAMATKADSNGAGSSLDKRGLAGAYRWGIGERHEFSVSGYVLENQNGMNYGMPYIRPTPSSPATESTLLPLDPDAYYGMASDINDGKAEIVTVQHVWRMAPRMELNTRLRHGRYERDQRAGTVRFAPAAQQPGGVAASLETFGPNTVLTRGTQLKIQDMENTFAQSDFSGTFDLGRMRHVVVAGIDAAQEKRRVYGDSPNLTGPERAALYASLGLAKPPTTVGTPRDGARIDESRRQRFETNRYTSDGVGVYLLDTVQVLPTWKLVAGVRYDRLEGDYAAHTYTYGGGTTAPGYDQLARASTASYRMKVSEPSYRAGVLWQPNERVSVHVSAANSFNTSGEAYSLSAQNANTPPEESINLELGAKIDSADGNFTTRVAAFRSTKLRERNLDPLVNLFLLSGKRHVAGAEIDFSGRLLPQWEIFASYMWLPVASIDQSTTAAQVGSRPGLTPRHSGSLWTTWTFTPRWRAGFGLNARSSQMPLNSTTVTVPRFVTGELMAEYTPWRDRFTIKANLLNVTNERYGESLYTGHYIPGAGRMLQVTGSVRF
jgi:catecholate siderophore receptor